MKNSLFSILCILLVLASCKNPDFLDSKNCSSRSSGVAAVNITFSMDSLNGGFTQSQLRNVYVFTDTYSDSVQITSPHFTIAMDGPASTCHNYVMIKNTNTSTITRFDNFNYYIVNKNCFPSDYNYAIKSLNYNSTPVENISYSNPLNVTIKNN